MSVPLLLPEEQRGEPGAVLLRKPEQRGGECFERVGLLGFLGGSANRSANRRLLRRIY
jgi:hypothetical protein